MTTPLPRIMAAPTGARRTKSDHPRLPITLAEILDDAVACHAAGAEALHLHVRDEDGLHSLDAGLYGEALAELATRLPGMPVQVTSEAAGVFTVAEQLHMLEQVRPAWASIALREIATDPDLADRVFGTCAQNGTMVQHILFDTDDLALMQRWQADGTIRPDQIATQLVLGRYTPGQVSDPATLAPFVQALPPGTPWMLCAFGAAEHACLLAADRMGGTMRVGFENSFFSADGTAWTSNAASVQALVAALPPAA